MYIFNSWDCSLHQWLCRSSRRFVWERWLYLGKQSSWQTPLKRWYRYHTFCLKLQYIFIRSTHWFVTFTKITDKHITPSFGCTKVKNRLHKGCRGGFCNVTTKRLEILNKTIQKCVNKNKNRNVFKTKIQRCSNVLTTLIC